MLLTVCRLFSRHQEAVDEGRTESAAQLPLIQRGDRLQRRFKQQ